MIGVGQPLLKQLNKVLHADTRPAGGLCTHLLVREEGLDLYELPHKVLGQAVHEVGALPAQGHVSTLQMARGSPVACGRCLRLALIKLEEPTVP